MQETQETQVRSLGLEDPLEKVMATHSSIPTWENPWVEKPGGLQSRGITKYQTQLKAPTWCLRIPILTPSQPLVFHHIRCCSFDPNMDWSMWWCTKWWSNCVSISKGRAQEGDLVFSVESDVPDCPLRVSLFTCSQVLCPSMCFRNWVHLSPHPSSRSVFPNFDVLKYLLVTWRLNSSR